MQQNNEDFQKQIEELAKTLTKEQIIILPFYHDLENEIKKPDRVRVQSAYFWEKWVPLLGPVASLLVMKLRQYCYYNRETKEIRDWCFPEQETLAKEIGISRYTIMREFKENPYLNYFIKREAQYRYSPETKKKVRTADKYYVRMEDPLTPEDEAHLAVKVAERIIKEAQKSPKLQNATQVNTALESQKSPKLQNATQDSCCKMPQQDIVLLRDTLNNVNVNEFKKISVENSKRKVSLRDDEYAKQLAKEMQDRKSLGWYRRVVECLDKAGERGLIQRARGEVLELAQSGNVKQSRGALFTALIKQYASERGIDL